ncbi:MAG: zinc ribbon domain-containing protein [Gemmatimonadaceae bacterium]
MNPVAFAVIAIALVGAIAFVWRKNESNTAPGASPVGDAAEADGRWQQALEEIAFDHARGVLSDADYAELRARYEAALDREQRRGDERVAAGAVADGGPPPTTESASPPASEHHHFVATDTVSLPPPPPPIDSVAVTAVASEPAADAAPLDAAEALVAQARANRVACVSCGTRPEPGARFCSTCGRALAPCPHCGATNHEPGARFCASCGSALV